MHARGRKFGVKMRPQIFLAQNLIFFNGSTAFRFPRNPRKSSSMAFRFLQLLKFDFLQWFNGFPISEKSKKIFFNGLPISSTAFRFLQRLSDVFNGFPLSETAFRFLQRLSDFPQRFSTFREIQENLSMAASIRKIAIRASYSRHKNIQTLNILTSTNRHSPHSLASV